MIHRILLGQLLLAPSKYVSKQIDEHNIKNLKALGSTLHAISIEVIDELIKVPSDDYDDGLGTSVYRKINMLPALKEEWVSKIKFAYKEWLDKFVALV